MAVDDVDDPCPRVGCDMPYSEKALVGEAFQQKTVNITAAKTCYVPMYRDGEPAVLMVRHTYDDLASMEFDPPHWAGEADVDDNADPNHPRDLSGQHATVFELIREATAENGMILMRDLRPKARKEGVPEEDLYPIALNLIYHEFVVENEDAVFKVPAEVVL